MSQSLEELVLGRLRFAGKANFLEIFDAFDVMYFWDIGAEQRFALQSV